MSKGFANKLITYKGEAGLLAVALIWGGGFVGSDLAVRFFTAYQVMGFRFLIAAVVMLIVFWNRLGRISRRTIKNGVVLGLILYVSFVMQTVGLVYTTPSKNAFLTAVNVVIVPFISYFAYKHRIDKFGLAGAAISLAGVALISVNSEFRIGIGDALTVLCAVGFAFHIFYTGKFAEETDDTVGLAIVQMCTAGVVGALVGVFTTVARIGDVKGGVDFLTALIAVIYLGLVSTALAFFLQTVSQKFTNQVRAAVILCSESAFGAIFSVVFLGEVMTLKLLFGSAIIFAAIIIAEIKPDFSKTIFQKKQNSL